MISREDAGMTDIGQPIYADQVERLIKVLGEIRDRLPEPEPVRQDWPTMWGYRLGQHDAPTASQVTLAREFLAGRISDQSTRTYPEIAATLARQILRRAAEQGVAE